jgi:glycogen debranching enzyme
MALLPPPQVGKRRTGFSGPTECIGHSHKSHRAEKMADWPQNVVKIQTSNEEFYRLLRQALEDLAALRRPIAGTDHMVFLPAAGLPWFAAPFGRDSLTSRCRTP